MDDPEGGWKLYLQRRIMDRVMLPRWRLFDRGNITDIMRWSARPSAGLMVLTARNVTLKQTVYAYAYTRAHAHARASNSGLKYPKWCLWGWRSFESEATNCGAEHATGLIYSFSFSFYYHRFSVWNKWFFHFWMYPYFHLLFFDPSWYLCFG